MKALLQFVREEPPVIIAVILAAANLIGIDLSEMQTEEIRQIIESILALLAGVGVRQMVSPTAKLKRKGIVP